MNLPNRYHVRTHRAVCKPRALTAPSLPVATKENGSTMVDRKF